VPGAGEVIELSPGRLYACLNPYAVDGRVSWHPPAARGFAPMNSYLLVEGEHALLIDSGVTAHREALLAQIDEVLAPSVALSILHTRIGEYNTICNTPAIAAARPVAMLYGSQPDPGAWTHFEPDPGAAPARTIAALDSTVLARENVLSVDPAGRRPVEVFAAMLRLLPTHWVYDQATATLFTSDMFSHVLRATPSGPWIVRDADGQGSREALREHLLQTRYWWIDGADTAPIDAWLDGVFAARTVERIAPGYGAILEGRELVAREVATLREILGELADSSWRTAAAS
jgi:hypothetical protein